MISNLPPLCRTDAYIEAARCPAGNSLSGSLPAALGLLSNLRILEASFNSITGTLPPELFSLPSLSYLLVVSACQGIGLAAR